MNTLPGVAFLPPISKDKPKKPENKIDEPVEVSIAIFNLVDGQAVGAPVGPNFSVEDGTIEIHGHHYHADWKTRDSALPNGAKVRVELRLANAPENVSACNVSASSESMNPRAVSAEAHEEADGRHRQLRDALGRIAARNSELEQQTVGGISADAGCIAFFDAQLWKKKGDVKKKGGDKDDILDLKNGQSLPIKFFIAPGAANTSPFVTITVPENAATFKDDEVISLSATALDLEEGDLAAGLSWTSNLAGDLGTGPSIKTAPLAIGTHVITAQVSDSAGRTGTASITVEVVQSAAPPAPPVVVGTNDAKVVGTTSTFTIVSVLQDIDGELIGEASKENFAIENFSVAKASSPDTPVSTGAASVSEVEVNEGNGEPLSLVLDFDESGSMTSNDRQRLRVQAGKQLVDLLMEDDQAAVIGFTSSTRVIQDFTTDKEELKDAIDQVRASGGTYIFRSLQKALDMLRDTSTTKRAIVLLTDGETADGNLFSSVVSEANDLNVPIYPVGLGSNLNFEQLRSLADETRGVFGEASKAEDLERVFQAVGLSVVEGSIRIAIDAALDTPLPEPGDYIITADLVTTVRQETFTTPVSFRVKVKEVSVPIPAVSEVSPTKASTEGGTVVTITGENLSGVTSVTFGGVSAADVKVDSSTQLTVTAPALEAGVVDLVVTTPGGMVTVSPFTFVAPPNIASITPDRSAENGGTSVTITGTNLAEATSVTFGGVEAAFTVNSDTRITATVPTGSEGSVKLNVRSPYGQSNALGFTYTTIPAPVLNTLSPREGASAGGTSVVLTGENLANITSVSFGGKTANFTQNSDTQITVTSPAGTGSADVKVATAGGTSNALSFGYIEPPVLTNISPNEGPTTGGTEVVLSGENLSRVTSVKFDGVAARFTVESDTRIVATAPAGNEGRVDVEVSSPFGVSGTTSFTYVAPLVQAPAIKSFFASEVTQLAELSWEIDEFNGEQLICEIDFGEYRGADLGSEQLADCVSVGSVNFLYPEGGEYTATLQVKNSSGETDSVTTTFRVIQQASQEVAFDTSSAQAAWQRITNTPEVSRLGLAFNTDAALVVEVDSTLGFIVPGVEATDHTIGVVSGDNVDLVLHMSYRVSDDVYVLRNVLENRVITMSAASQYADSSLASTKLEAFASQLLPLLSSPLLNYNPSLSGAPRSNLLHASCLQQVSSSSDPCAGERSGYRWWSTWMGITGAGTMAGIYGTAYACGLGMPVGCSIGLFTTPIAFTGFVLATRGASNAQQRYKACLRQNFNVESGSSVIAMVSVPLPFSNQVFVQSVPDNLNLATGYLSPNSSTSDIANLLESAIPNAEFIFEEFSNTYVLEGGTQVDPHFREIVTTYVSRTPTLSDSGCGIYSEPRRANSERSSTYASLTSNEPKYDFRQTLSVVLGATKTMRRQVLG